MVEFIFRRPKFIGKDDLLIDESKLSPSQEILFMFLPLQLGQMVERKVIIDILKKHRTPHPDVAILNTLKQVRDDFELERDGWTILSVSGKKQTSGGGRDPSLGWMVVEK